MKIYGFYHIAAMNDYKSLVIKQLKHLKESKLLSKTDKLNIGLIGDDTCINEVKKILIELEINNFEIFYWGSDLLLYEFPTINLIKKTSETDDFYCYYFHTKGISITPSNCEFYGSKNYEIINNAVNSWREYMEFFIFERFEDAINGLNNFDSVGVSITDKPTLHYVGNFWWSKSEKIIKLDYIPINTSRHNAEFWIGDCGKTRMLSLAQKEITYTNIIKDDYKHEKKY